MKRIALIAILFLFLSAPLFGENTVPKDPNQLFYRANTYYAERDYVKALEAYDLILGMGLESGNLYYNIGNSFSKLGKTGYAMLFYEKANRIIPQDGDLKSNLAYAKSLAPDSGFQVPAKNPVIRIIKRPFRDSNLNAITISATIGYLIVVLGLALFILNPILLRKFRLVFAILIIIFLLNVGAFALRYYDEEMLRYGIVVQKEVDCKYEPIDKSTTYYKLQEGAEVLILTTRDDWRKIRRLDGKISWVKKEAVGGI